MADLVLTGLYEDKQREFGTRGSGLARFDEDFISAARRVVQMTNLKADLETTISLSADATDATVTNFDEKYEYVFADGLSWHLLKMGRRPPKGAEKLVREFHDDFINGIGDISFDLKNDLQDADEENDSIGLPDLYDD